MLEEHLAPAEKLRLWRWRKKLSLREAASLLGEEYETVRRWEKGESDIPDVPLGGLNQNERYVVLRFRQGITGGEIARRMGCSRSKVEGAERGTGKIDVLQEFWGTIG